MNRLKLPLIIVIVLAAVGAGLFASGMVGGTADGPVKKHVIEPISLSEPFAVNLADTDSERFAVINVALELEPMDEDHWATFTGEDAGGHGGGDARPGPAMVAAYPKFHDAVISVTSGFTYGVLSTPEGKDELRTALLGKFAEIAEQDAAAYEAGAKREGDVHPPFHVMDVYFTKYLVK